MTEIRKCCDCRHGDFGRPGLYAGFAPPRCWHPNNAERIGRSAVCNDERFAGNCGPEGKLFEKREPTPPRKPLLRRLRDWLAKEN